MKTLFYLFSCGLLLAAATWSYNVNYATRDAAKRVAGLEASIDSEIEKIDMLRAEWDYLNRPERLLRLAEANFETLGLVPLRPDHFGNAGKVTAPGDRIDGLILKATIAAARNSEE